MFAVPCSPLDPRAEGTSGLIKQGATPVTETADVRSFMLNISAINQRSVDAWNPMGTHKCLLIPDAVIKLSR